MADDYDRLIATFKRLKLVRTLPTLDVRTRPRRRIRPRELTPIPDRPRVQLPDLTHALRRRDLRWHATCRGCGVTWRGWVRDVTQPAAVLATLAVMRVPCPVCWARVWASSDQATRDAWSLVPSWLTPRWR